MSWVVVDAPKVDAGNVPATLVAATSPLAYVRFHGRNAGTWNSRGGSAATRFDYLYGEDELREWVSPLRELSNQAEETYAFFNNNNQTNGVAQAPAGAQLLRRLLDEEHVPVRLMRVLAVTHGPLVGPELFGDVIARCRARAGRVGDRARTAALRTTATAPCSSSAASQNVGEEVRHPWLHDEYAALRRWLDDRTPLLGICLGAQTLGARARRRRGRARRRPAGGLLRDDVDRCRRSRTRCSGACRRPSRR